MVSKENGTREEHRKLTHHQRMRRKKQSDSVGVVRASTEEGDRQG